MTPDDDLAYALAASLAMRPDGRPGVARLAQELLAHTTGLPLRYPPAPRVEHRIGSNHIGGTGNRIGPWGGRQRRKAEP